MYIIIIVTNTHSEILYEIEVVYCQNNNRNEFANEYVRLFHTHLSNTVFSTFTIIQTFKGKS